MFAPTSLIRKPGRRYNQFMSLRPYYRIAIYGAAVVAAGALVACSRGDQRTAASPSAVAIVRDATNSMSPSALELLKATLTAMIEPSPPPLTTSPKLSMTEFALIAGEDADRNGVRDDLDRAVKKSPSLTPPQRSALVQSFRAMQSAVLVDLDDDQAVERARGEMLDGWQCVARQFGFDDANPGIIQFIATLEERALDTPQRKNRFDNLSCDAVKVLLVDPAARPRLKTNPCQ